MNHDRRHDRRKFHPALDSLEVRETPAVMGAVAALTAAAPAATADGGGLIPTEPTSTNLTQNSDGAYNPPGTFFNGGMANTNSLSVGLSDGGLVPTEPTSTNLTQNSDGAYNPPGTFFNGGMANTNSLSVGTSVPVAVTTAPVVAAPSPVAVAPPVNARPLGPGTTGPAPAPVDAIRAPARRPLPAAIRRAAPLRVHPAVGARPGMAGNPAAIRRAAPLRVHPAVGARPSMGSGTRAGSFLRVGPADVHG